MLFQSKTSIWLAALLLVAFMVWAGAYSVLTPAWEAPDEAGHFGYAAYLVQHRALPVQRLHETSEFHQPPLYYVITALAMTPADLHDPTGALNPNPGFIWAGQGGNETNLAFHISAETFPFQGLALALHLARVVSVLLGMLTVALTIAIGWEIFPEQRWIGLLSGSLVAFNPQFLFISGAINNDNLLVAAATGVWWLLLRAIKFPDQWRRWVWVGLVVGIGLLAKTSMFVMGLVAGLALVACAIQRRSIKMLVRGALGMGGSAALVAGWWFGRNQLLYGDPLGWSIFRINFKSVLRRGPLPWSKVQEFFTVQFRSFWGVFGWMNVNAPGWFYTAVQVVLGVSLLGLALWLARRRYKNLSGFSRSALVLLGLAIAAQEGYMLWAITRFNESWYQGRYLFPVIGPLMILVSLGLVSWLPKRWSPVLATGLAVMLATVAVFMQSQVIQPAYAVAPSPKWALWLVPNKTEYTFGNTIELAGYKIKEQNNTQVVLILYWRAKQKPDFDYSAFVHLVDGANRLVAQDDHAPGKQLGYQPTAWWPGDIVEDEHVMTLPGQLAAGGYRFRVGLYNWITGERLSVLSGSQPAGDSITLDQVLHRR
jgi:4-amino-4-deoxy-L-arabinose transferase-like glycosyltransferase